MPKPLIVCITTNCGKFLKRWKYQTTLLASWEICMQVKKQQLEPDMEQRTGSKLGKEYIKAVYCYPAYLIYIQSTSCEMPGWMKHKLESRLLGEMSITSDMQMIPLLCQKAKRNWRASWWKWKRRVKKLAWNSAFRKLRSWHRVHHFMATRWENNGNSDRLLFCGSSKITAVGDCSLEIKRHLLLGRKVMTNRDSILKSRDITLPTKVCLSKLWFFH